MEYSSTEHQSNEEIFMKMNTTMDTQQVPE